MICPHCGAETGNAITLCPLCGKELDREQAFISFVQKGDNAAEIDDVDKAILNYNKALTYSEGNGQIYVKLGNLYFKKNDKNAVNVYLKALQFNFYNEYVHNMLITLYSRFNKLDDLKTWYEKNRGKYREDFINKYVGIIDNTKSFSAKKDFGIKEKHGNVFKDFLISMKKYMLLNVVLCIVTVLLIAGLLSAVFLHLNPFIVFSFMLFFLFVIFVIVLFQRISQINKKKKEKIDFSDLLGQDLDKKNKND
jgi:tetratricopeptide (TPR) repeat protein